MTTDPQTARYRHRTTEVEAVQWTGSNADVLRAFCGPDFDEIAPEDRTENPDASAAVRESKHGTWRGLEPGYWVVKIGEEFYEESPADFAAQFEPVPAPAADRAVGVADAIRTFPFDNFGMDDVSFALEDDPEAQEWVPALADAVLATLPATTAQAVELRDYWHAEAMSATTRIIELEGQLEESRRAAAEPAADRPAGEAYRLAVSAALRLGTGATWEAIRDRAEDLTAEVAELTEARRRVLDRPADELPATPDAGFVLWLDASDGSVPTHDGIRWPDGTATLHHRHFGYTTTHPDPEAARQSAHGKQGRLAWPAPAAASVGQAAHTTRSAGWRAVVSPRTLHAIAVHLDARAVSILRPESDVYAEWQAVAAELRRMADETQQQTETPCGPAPDQCDPETGEPCDVHEVERAHAEGDHEHCGKECEVAMPSEQLRNAILCRAIPGSAGMLDELLRRAAVVPAGAGEDPAHETREAEAHPPTRTWKVESPRRDKWASWGATHDERVWAAASYDDVIEIAPQRPFRLVRATTTYAVEAEHQPAAVSQPGKEH